MSASNDSSILDDHNFGRINSYVYRTTTRTATSLGQLSRDGRNRLPDFLDILSYISVLYKQDAMPMQVFNDSEMESIGSGAVFRVLRKKSLNTANSSENQSSKPGIVIKRTPKLRFKHDGSLNQRDFLQRNAAYGMLRELQVLATTDIKRHENVVDLLGVAWSYAPCPNGCPDIGLVLESADCTLAVFLENSRDFLFVAKRDICRNIACGLAAVHQCGIIHGDIKPDNILMFRNNDSKWTAKVADFSHSQLCTESSWQRVGGTTQYEAPESNAVMPPEMLMKGDIYSFGIVIGCVIAGSDIIACFFNRSRMATDDDRNLELERFKKEDRLATFILEEIYRVMDTDLSFMSSDLVLVELWLEDTLQLRPEMRDLGSVTSFQSANENVSGELNTPAVWDPDFIDIPYQALNSLSNVLKNHIVQNLERIVENTGQDQTPLRIAAAEFELCICYTAGFGVESDRTKALDWLCKAAHHGEMTAQSISFRLIEAFNGKAALDAAEIDQWLIAAAGNGSWTAIQSLRDRGSASYPAALQNYRNAASMYSDAYDFDALLSSFRCSMPPKAEFYTAPRNDHGQTFLHWAAMRGLEEVFNFLLENVVLMPIDLNVQDHNGDTALLYACRSGRHTIARSLVTMGASAKLCNLFDENALHFLYAIEDDHIASLATFLVENGADVTQESKVTKAGKPSTLIFDLRVIVSGSPILRALTLNVLPLVQILLALRKKYHPATNARERLLWKSTCYELIGWACRLSNHRVLEQITDLFPEAFQSLQLPTLRLRMHNLSFTLPAIVINGCVSENPLYGFDFPEAFWRCMYHGRDYSNSLRCSFEALKVLGVDLAGARCGKHRNALFFAIEKGHREAVSILIELYGSPSPYDAFGYYRQQTHDSMAYKLDRGPTGTALTGTQHQKTPSTT
ncbi:hypothetical protein F4803DRAFT_545340 [Xylaria telfairii]|nr:hypothetical protein F4803DRAFT_545340 [Xylaria telfairii]